MEESKCCVRASDSADMFVLRYPEIEEYISSDEHIYFDQKLHETHPSVAGCVSIPRTSYTIASCAQNELLCFLPSSFDEISVKKNATA